jgi:hypothetical protein
MAKTKKDANYPDEDAIEHPIKDYYAEPFQRRRNYRDIELLTPEKRKAKNQEETSEALRNNRPLPSRVDDIIEKYNREESGERNKDIELPNEGPSIKIEITPKRKRSVGNY